jgi:hypothetical protein
MAIQRSLSKCHSALAPLIQDWGLEDEPTSLNWIPTSFPIAVQRIARDLSHLGIGTRLLAVTGLSNIKSGHQAVPTFFWGGDAT